jgi:hypothetical protein
MPTPRQVAAHRAEEPYLLYGGAVGGGKSAWIVNDALRQCIRYPGNRVGVYRWEYSSYKDTTHDEMQKFVLCVPGLVEGHNQQEHRIDLINGSSIVYGGLRPSSTKKDAMSTVRSLQINALYIDEMSDVPKDVYEFACTRVPRVELVDQETGRRFHPSPRVAGTSNPTMGWIKTMFVDRPDAFHRFIPSTVYDNSHLSPEYVRTLERAWADRPDWKNTLLLGNWEAAVDATCIILAPWLLKARHRMIDPGSPVVLGVDVAAGGSDRTVVVCRRGMVAEILYAERGYRDTMVTVDLVASLCDQVGATRICIDSVGVGKGVYDRLAQLEYPVEPMSGGERATEPEAYANRRAEWYWTLRVLLESGRVRLPDHDELINEIGDIRYKRTASGRQIQVESKDKIKERLGHSPDFADATAYAFADAIAADVSMLV